MLWLGWLPGPQGSRTPSAAVLKELPGLLDRLPLTTLGDDRLAVRRLAADPENALRADPGFGAGLNVSAGRILHPGLAADPSYPVAADQMRRFGGLVSIELADAAAVHALVERSELLVAATSFGGLHTSVDRRARWGDDVADGFARISAGIEDTDDLISDIVGSLSSL